MGGVHSRTDSCEGLTQTFMVMESLKTPALAFVRFPVTVLFPVIVLKGLPSPPNVSGSLMALVFALMLSFTWTGSVVGSQSSGSCFWHCLTLKTTDASEALAVCLTLVPFMVGVLDLVGVSFLWVLFGSHRICGSVLDSYRLGGCLG